MNQEDLNKGQAIINANQNDINRNVEAHLAIANEEVGKIKEDIAGIKVDIVWIKETMAETKKVLEKFDNRTWTILATIILGFLLQIIFKLYK